MATRSAAQKAAKGRPVARVSDAGLVEHRRAQIVEAATRLVARQGFANTVVRDIAEEAKISVGLVYEYVRSKEDILFLIYDYSAALWKTGFEEALPGGGDPFDQLRAAVTFLVDVTHRHADITHLYYREVGNLTPEGRELAKTYERDMVGRLAGLIEQAMQTGQLRPDTDPIALATQLVLLTHGWTLKGYLVHEHRTPRSWADSILNTTIRGWATTTGCNAWERRRAP